MHQTIAFCILPMILKPKYFKLKPRTRVVTCLFCDRLLMWHVTFCNKLCDVTGYILRQIMWYNALYFVIYNLMWRVIFWDMLLYWCDGLYFVIDYLMWRIIFWDMLFDVRGYILIVIDYMIWRYILRQIMWYVMGYILW